MTRKAQLAAALLLGIAVGVAVTQPTTSNWSDQGGENWHVGGDLDIETGGEIDVESGASLILDSGSTLTNAAASTHSGATTFSGTVTQNSTVTASAAVEWSGSSTTVQLPLTVSGNSYAASGLSLGDTDYMVWLEPTANVTVLDVGTKTATGFTVTYICDTADTTVRAAVLHY